MRQTPQLLLRRFLPFLALTALIACAGEKSETGTGYPTTAAALNALRAQPGVTFSNSNGWMIANDPKNETVWSFTPQGNPAYPAVVKRQFLQTDGKYELKMTSNCEAPMLACQQLLMGFAAKNEAMVQQLNTAR